MSYFEQAVSTVERPYKPIVSANGGVGIWRTDEPKMFEGAVTLGGMWSHQLNWWNLPQFIKVFVGGYGAGKTLICGKRAIASALHNAPCPIAVVSPSFPLANKTVVETIKSLLAGKQSIYGSAFFWRFNKQSHTFTIRFRGRTGTIYICSGEIPDSLRGPNLAAAYLDEPFLMGKSVFVQMNARVRHPDAKLKEIGLTGTPEQLNWGWELCVGELKEQIDKAHGGTGKGVGYIQASTLLNLAIDPEVYVKQLEAVLTAKAAKAYIDGSFINLSEGMVYYAFDGLDNELGNVRSLGVPEECELGCGMDFNVNPMSATVFWRAGSHIHVFDEIELPNADTEFMCQVLRERYVEDGPKRIKSVKQKLETVYPDATGSARKTAAPGGKSDFWYIKQAGFTIRAPFESPKRRDRYNSVNGKFSPKGGKPTLTVDPKCKKLIKYLSTYSYELLNKQEAMSHLLDAFSYPVSYLFPVSRESLQGVHKLQGA